MKKSLILLGFLLSCPGVLCADWTTTQIRDIVSDVGKIEDHTSLANTYLSNIWSDILSFDADFKYLNNQIYNELLTGNSTLNSLSTNSLNLLIETVQNGYKIEDGFVSVSNLLSQINTSISNLSNSSSSTNSFDLSVLDDIYVALTTNQLSFAGRTWDCLQNLSTNIDIYASELLATNGIQITTIETCSSNIVSAITSLTNDVSNTSSKLNSINNTLSTISIALSSISNKVNNLVWSNRDISSFISNYNLMPWFENGVAGQYRDIIQQSDWYWDYIWNVGNAYSWGYTNGENSFKNIQLAQNVGNWFSAYDGVISLNDFIVGNYYRKNIDTVISNSWNSVTNKTQSIPYTVILPELSNVGGEPNIYSALTNAYLTSYNQQSDLTWLDRVELLLAALVFPDTSATNTVENADTAQSASEQTAQQFSDQLGQVTSALISGNPSQDFQTTTGHLTALLDTLKQHMVIQKPEVILIDTIDQPLEWIGAHPTDGPIIDTQNSTLGQFADFLRNIFSFCWVAGFFVMAYKSILLIFRIYAAVYNFSQALFRRILS